MASKHVKSINSGYKHRYTKKSAKGQGVYAHGLPGTPNGVHLSDTRARDCRCGGCNAR